MPCRKRCALSLLAALLCACGDDSTSPPDDVPAPLSRMIGSAGQETHAGDIVVTSDGLRVLTGVFTGTLHVSGSSDSLVATDDADVFLAALREDGTLAWKRGIAGTGFAFPYSIARDSNDNFYLSGYSVDNSTFGTIGLTGYGGFDVLVAKLDATGNPLWAVGGGAGGNDYAYDVAVATDGGAFVCGVASSEIILAGEDVGEFDHGTGFLIKIKPDGVGHWATTVSGLGSSHCTALVRPGDGSILVCARYSEDDIYIGGELLPLDGDYATVISRFTEAGVLERNIRVGGSGGSNPEGLTHIDGEAVVAGRFYGTVDFDVNTAAGEVTAVGDEDAYIARYRKDGSLRWVRTYGTLGAEMAMSVSRLGESDLLLGGFFTSYITLGATTLPTNGGLDVFMARLDGNGNVRSAGAIGGPGSEFRVAVRSAGSSALVLGQGIGTIRFPDGARRPAFGLMDVFLYQEP